MTTTDFSVDGAAAEAILGVLADGRLHSVTEIASRIGMTQLDAVRNQLARLCDKCQVSRHGEGAVGRGRVLYQMSARQRPFLLQVCWRRVVTLEQVA